MKRFNIYSEHEFHILEMWYGFWTYSQPHCCVMLVVGGLRIADIQSWRFKDL